MARPYNVKPRGPAIDKPCEECGKRSILRVYRLDPVNWRPHERLLCRECSRRHGYTPVSYERAYAGTGTGG